MAFAPIPPNNTALGVLERAAKEDSFYVPSLSFLFVNQAGLLALSSCRDGVSLRLIEGTVYRPRHQEGETILSKVDTTIRTRTRAALGSAATVIPELVTLVPYKYQARMQLDRFEVELWPNALGKFSMPVIVPVRVGAADPQQARETKWLEPKTALNTLQNNYNSYHTPPTKIAFDALQVSMPGVSLVAQTFAAQEAAIAPEALPQTEQP